MKLRQLSVLAVLSFVSLGIFAENTATTEQRGMWLNRCRLSGESGATYGSMFLASARGAFDGNLSSGASTGRAVAEEFPAWVAYDFGESARIDAYAITLSNYATSESNGFSYDQNRAPRSFALYGTDSTEAVYSEEMTGWTKLDVRRNESNWKTGGSRVYRLSQVSAANFRRYMLVIFRPGLLNNKYVQFGELELLDSTQPGQQVRYLAESDDFASVYATNETAHAQSSIYSRAAWTAPGAATGEPAAAGCGYVVPADRECIGAPQAYRTRYVFAGDSLTVEDGGIFSGYNDDSSQGWGLFQFNRFLIRPGGRVRFAPNGGNNQSGAVSATFFVEGGTEKKAPMFSFHNPRSSRLGYAWRFRPTGLAGSGVVMIKRETETMGTEQRSNPNTVWPGAFYWFDNMSKFTGQIVLSGLPPLSNGTRFPGNLALVSANAHNMAYSIKMKAHSTIVVPDGVPSDTPINVPIELTAGDPAMGMCAYFSGYKTVYVSSKVTGGGDFTVMSVPSHWNQKSLGFTNTATIVFKDMEWAGGNIAVSNVTLRLENTRIPAGVAITDVGGGIVEYLQDFDEEREPEDWPAGLPVTALKSITTRRSAPLLLGTHRVMKLPQGTTLEDLTAFDRMISGPAYQASWLNEPEWSVDAEGCLVVTLTEKGVYKHTAKNMPRDANIGLENDWYVESYWEDGTRPAAGDNCFATNTITIAGNDPIHRAFPAAGLYLDAGQTLVLCSDSTITNLYLGRNARIANAYAPSGTLRGNGVTVCGSGTNHFINSDWRSPQTIIAPWIGATTAVVRVTMDGGSSKGRILDKGVKLYNPSPEFRGTFFFDQVRALMGTYGTNTFHVWLQDESVLGTLPAYRPNALVVKGQKCYVTPVAQRDLVLRDPRRGIQILNAAGFDAANETITVLSPLEIVAGVSSNRGPGQLTIGGTATARSGTGFCFENGTFRPLTGECFKDANLVFGTNVTLRLSPAESDACLVENGLVNVKSVTVEYPLELDVDDVAASVFTAPIVRVPVMTLPEASAAGVLAKLKLPSIPCDGLRFFSVRSPVYPSCRLISLGRGNLGTVLMLR